MAMVFSAVTRTRRGAKAAEPKADKPKFVGRTAIPRTAMFEPYAKESAAETIWAAIAAAAKKSGPGAAFTAVVMELLRTGYCTLNEIPDILRCDGKPRLTEGYGDEEKDTKEWAALKKAIREKHQYDIASGWVRDRITVRRTESGDSTTSPVEVGCYGANELPLMDSSGNHITMDVTETAVSAIVAWMFTARNKPIKFAVNAGARKCDVTADAVEFDVELQDLTKQKFAEIERLENLFKRGVVTNDEMKQKLADIEDGFERAFERAKKPIESEWHEAAEGFRVKFGQLFRTRNTAIGTIAERSDGAAAFLIGSLLGPDSENSDE